MQHTNRLQVNFMCTPGYLDMYSLSYRWFGTVWTYNEDLQLEVRGYWFGDTKDDVIKLAKYSGWQSFVEVRDTSCIKQIYELLRKEQQKLDWNKRTRIPLRRMLSKQWRTIKTGWYVLRSREQYPLYLSSIEKRGWLAYLSHATLCENDSDKLHFIDKVNREHNIKLKECQWTGGLYKHGGVNHE